MSLQEPPDSLEVGFARAVGAQSVVADPHKATGQYMLQEAMDELLRFHAHGPPDAALRIVLVAKGDLGVVDGDQPIVGDATPWV